MIRLFVSLESIKLASRKAAKKKINYYDWFLWWLTAVVKTFFPILYLFEEPPEDYIKIQHRRISEE